MSTLPAIDLKAWAKQCNLAEIVAQSLRDVNSAVDDPSWLDYAHGVLAALTAAGWPPCPVEAWHDGAETPDVKPGEMKYFLVAFSDGKPAFGAYYLNQYPLMMDECPDCTEENKWTSCKSCDNGDGHRSTGWFDEQTSADYDDTYYPLTVHVIAWREPPIYRTMIAARPKG